VALAFLVAFAAAGVVVAGTVVAAAVVVAAAAGSGILSTTGSWSRVTSTPRDRLATPPPVTGWSE
jgi:hypothetical protein